MVGFINKWARNWVFYHIVYWIFVLLTFFWDVREYAPYDLKGYLSTVFIRTALLAALTYVNLFFLIPKVYPRSKILYWLLIVFSIYLFVNVYRMVYFMTTDEVGEVFRPPSIDITLGRMFVAIRFLLVSFLFKFLKGWFDQEKKISQIKVDQLSTELKYLRAQVNPHFLFNTLNNLYGLALKKSDKAPDVILRLSDIMDYMLYESTEIKVPLRKDVDNLINYIELEKIRQGNNAKIIFTINGEPESQKIIPLLMLPLLENGFKHGVNKEMINAYLDGHLEITPTSIELTVVNNMTAKPAETGDGHGIGLQNLKKRLELFYPKKHELSFVQKNHSYKAYLKIDLA